MTSFAEVQETDEWQELALPAKDFYTYALPYHNWDHALDVAERAVGLAERCDRRGIILDGGMLAVAAAWHDAGFHDNHAVKGFKTKEAYSSALAADFLQKQGVASKYIDRVQLAIIGTTHAVPRVELDTLALHRADLGNIGDEYDIFLRSSHSLLLEARLDDPQKNFAQWQWQQQGFLKFVLEEAVRELPMLGEPIGTAGAYDMNAARNVGLLGEEIKESDVVGRLAHAHTRH